MNLVKKGWSLILDKKKEMRDTDGQEEKRRVTTTSMLNVEEDA